MFVCKSYVSWTESNVLLTQDYWYLIYSKYHVSFCVIQKKPLFILNVTPHLETLTRVFESLNKSIVPSNIYYNTRLSRQYNCWSLRSCWSLACRRYSNYIFILDFTSGFNIMHKDNFRTRLETVKVCDMVPYILEVWLCMYFVALNPQNVSHNFYTSLIFHPVCNIGML